MAFLVRLDQRIISTLEAMLHRFQKLTGKTNYWVYHQVLVLQILSVMIWAVSFFTYTSYSIIFRIFAVVLSLIIGRLVFIPRLLKKAKTVEDREAEAFERLASGIANPKKIDEDVVVSRIIAFWMSLFLVWLFHLWAPWVNQILVLGGTLELYLLACDPLPPRAGKIQDWLQFFRKAPVPQESRI
jgi:hypothetical protein